MKKFVFPILMICVLLFSCKNNSNKEVVVTKMIISQEFDGKFATLSFCDKQEESKSPTYLLVLTGYSNEPDSVVNIHWVNKKKYDSVKKGDIFK